jgi:hypothetical protein
MRVATQAVEVSLQYTHIADRFNDGMSAASTEDADAKAQYKAAADVLLKNVKSRSACVDGKNVSLFKREWSAPSTLRGVVHVRRRG